MKANMGIMITASHNPYYDNGLKLFGPDGLKLSDKIEKKIEALIDQKTIMQLSKPKVLGRVKRLENGNDEYIKILRKNFPKNFNSKRYENRNRLRKWSRIQIWSNIIKNIRCKSFCNWK